jgi:hypothetical protein
LPEKLSNYDHRNSAHSSASRTGSGSIPLRSSPPSGAKRRFSSHIAEQRTPHRKLCALVCAVCEISAHVTRVTFLVFSPVRDDERSDVQMLIFDIRDGGRPPLVRRTMRISRTYGSGSRRVFRQPATYSDIGLFPPVITGPQTGYTKSLVHMHSPTRFVPTTPPSFLASVLFPRYDCSVLVVCRCKGTLASSLALSRLPPPCRG